MHTPSSSERSGSRTGRLLAPSTVVDRWSAALSVLDESRAVARIWERDHTVWRDDPTELANRLGWLDVPRTMRSNVPRIREYVEGLMADGVRDVVLLGMGGSSLAPEVFRRTFGSAPGHPRLHVLDTTSPAWIRRITGVVDPEHLHVLVASKSGSTIEVRTLAAHFEEVARRASGDVGNRFTAITDPGTQLAQRARDGGWRATFENPADIGGRYSALSLFGLVPAGILGIDLDTFLERADRMAIACRVENAAENPGASLGALMGSSAHAGRDKLTLQMAPAIDSFGLWIEQLVAESTGKEGRGVVPVDGETIGVGAPLGDDRLFVVTEGAGDDATPEQKAAGDAWVAAGHPVLRLGPIEPIDLGAEMFRWEMATAIAGAVLDVQPFDQPDVQSTKTATGKILETISAGGAAPAPVFADPAGLLAAMARRDWVALMLYGDPSEELLAAAADLRAAILARTGAATTLGVGPRFLHSTGQLHKGGGDGGVFLQLVLDEGDLPIPGFDYGFGGLMSAQAAGDLAALAAAGRRVARLDPGGDPAAALRRLAEGLVR